MSEREVRARVAVGDDEIETATFAPDEPFAAMAIAHGAGFSMDHPFMVGFARRMAELGVAAVRFNFLYTQKGRKAPDPEPRLRAAWLAAFDASRAAFPDRPALAAGKSLGGRIASMCVADGMSADGLVFLGYPFHPPGKTDRVRDEHLYRIDVPMLFLEGTRDPFADAAVQKRVLGKLADRAELIEIEGGDHSFNVRGEKRDPAGVGASLADLALPFVRRVAGVA
jgi:predicted alpha/beta-hydrolase family hydrolase